MTFLRSGVAVVAQAVKRAAQNNAQRAMSGGHDVKVPGVSTSHFDHYCGHTSDDLLVACRTSHWKSESVLVLVSVLVSLSETTSKTKSPRGRMFPSRAQLRSKDPWLPGGEAQGLFFLADGIWTSLCVNCDLEILFWKLLDSTLILSFIAIEILLLS
jgi:hypothetical protein